MLPDKIEVLTGGNGILHSILLRPTMYFGDGEQALTSLAAFINGYMTHRSGLDMASFGHSCLPDYSKSLEENALTFKEMIDSWEKVHPSWGCCVDRKFRD